FELSLGETILTNSDVDTVELLLIVLAIIPALLVENSVNSNNSPAGLTVTNNKLTLTTTDWDHDIDWLESSHYRQVDRATGSGAFREARRGSAASMGLLALIRSPKASTTRQRSPGPMGTLTI
ncbi:hypothetical protein SCLCIDRAFT_1185799, partial [Scleroderma citrinum Foug A]